MHLSLFPRDLGVLKVFYSLSRSHTFPASMQRRTYKSQSRVSESLNKGKDVEIFSPRIRHLQVIRRPERAWHSDWDGTKWRDCALNVSEPISIILPPSLPLPLISSPPLMCVTRRMARMFAQYVFTVASPKCEGERVRADSYQ